MSEETATETIHCWPWSHKWTKWEDYRIGSLFKNDKEVGFVIFQETRCVKCNKKYLRATRTTIYHSGE